MRQRKSRRLQSWTYATPAVYAITLCTHQRLPLFGTLRDGRLDPSIPGQIAIEELRRTEALRPEVVIDAFAVMPDHVHALVVLLPPGMNREDLQSDDRYDIRHIDVLPHTPHARLHRPPGSLGSFVAGYKAAVTSRIIAHRGTPGAPVWQRNYWDRVIRNDKEWRRFRPKF